MLNLFSFTDIFTAWYHLYHQQIGRADTRLKCKNRGSDWSMENVLCFTVKYFSISPVFADPIHGYDKNSKCISPCTWFRIIIFKNALDTSTYWALQPYCLGLKCGSTPSSVTLHKFPSFSVLSFCMWKMVIMRVLDYWDYYMWNIEYS